MHRVYRYLVERGVVPYTPLVQALVGAVALYASVGLLAWYKETELRRRRGLYSRSPGVTRRGPAGEETSRAGTEPRPP